MSDLHHHHMFEHDENDEPVWFDGILIHDHPDEYHWNVDAYYGAHRPLGGQIDDSHCLEGDKPCLLTGIDLRRRR